MKVERENMVVRQILEKVKYGELSVDKAEKECRKL